MIDLPTFLAVFVRTTTWATLSPFIGDKGIPAKMRMAASVLFAVALHTIRPHIGWDRLFFALPGEVAVGVICGFSVRLVISGAEAAGQLIGTHLELGFASNFDPLMKEESLPTRRIAYALAGLAFLGVGGLEAAVRMLSAPGLSSPEPMGLLRESMTLLAQASGYALALAGPVLCAAVVANLSMGLASRAAPALNAFSVVLSCVLVLGGLAAISTAPMFVHGLWAVARNAMEAPLHFF
jgi:flagellar biosynthetic protein FliR